MKKLTIYKIIPYIMALLLFACAIFYVQIYGMSNDDVINRTENFWIPSCLLLLSCTAIHADTFIDTITKRDWLTAIIQIIQVLIIIVAAIYCYMITVQIIHITKQIECLYGENHKQITQLFHIRSDLISKRNWTILASLWIAYFLKGIPYLIGKITNWVHKKRGEDQ